jgi:LysM repeat protein
MKAFRTILSSMLICLSIVISAPEMKAQQTLKSQIVTEYDGKPYYIHTVKKKQTLKEIADIYGVAVYDIIKENKGVKTSPKAGELLRIPYKQQEEIIFVEEVVDTVVEKTMGENTITMIQGNLDAVYKGIVSDEYLELLTEGTKEDAEQAYLETEPTPKS